MHESILENDFTQCQTVDETHKYIDLNGLRDSHGEVASAPNTVQFPGSLELQKVGSSLEDPSTGDRTLLNL